MISAAYFNTLLKYSAPDDVMRYDGIKFESSTWSIGRFWIPDSYWSVSVLQVSQLEQELEKERTTSLHQLRRKQVEVEETKQEVQKKEKQTAELSASIKWVSHGTFLLFLKFLQKHWQFCLMAAAALLTVYDRMGVNLTHV